MSPIANVISHITNVWIEEIGIPQETLGCSISPEKMLLELINKAKLEVQLREKDFQV